MLLSILIPCWNEEKALKKLLPYLLRTADNPEQLEIIVIDGQSTDDSKSEALKAGAQVLLSKRGRAIQMNAGASAAKGSILYFLHADSFPPVAYDRHIREACLAGHKAGCFRLQFDEAPAGLRFFAWMSRFNWPICRGGDQSLFADKIYFQSLGGFDEQYTVYEDNQLTGRIYKSAIFKIIPLPIVTSSRKYKELGWLYLQWHFGLIHLQYYLGKSPATLKNHYQKNIQSKLKNHS